MNMTMQDEAFDGLTDPEWDRLAGGHFYSSSKWLRYCAHDTGVPGRAVVVVSESGEPVVGVPVRELAHLPPWSRYRWNDHLKEFGLPTLPDSGTLIGPPEGFQTHFLAARGRPPQPALEKLIEQIQQHDGPDRASVAMYLTSEGVRAAKAAGVESEPVLLDVDAWIPVPPEGWDAWLDTFSSKRAKTIRREDRRFHEAGYRIDHFALSECADSLGRASASTLRKYGHETTEAHEVASLHMVAACMGEQARVAVCSLEPGKPLGFCIYYLHDDAVLLRWAGFDYEHLSGSTEYFNVGYYCQVKLAPTNGVRWLHAGATAQAAKALRGAELRPLWMLDLSPDSRLAGSRAQIVDHNRRLYRKFSADPRIEPALVPDDLWDELA